MKQKSKNLAISDISKRLNEKLHIAESQLQNQSELREKLDVVQTELQAEKDRHLKTRQKVATAIEAIPDSIVVLNTLRETIDRNEKDLANAKKLLLESVLSPVRKEQGELPKT
jgi:antitoxin component HigA of HigAB toxin-antitoxin module